MSPGDAGAAGIAQMLIDESCPLRKLDLRSSNLGSSGASIVGKALAVNTSLETLCLGKNNVTDDAIPNLVSALQMNATLRTLDVQYNPISDVGANYIARCLDESNFTLRKLKLRHCDAISNEMKETLVDILTMNSYGPELAFKTKDALRSVLVEETTNSDNFSNSNIDDESQLTNVSLQEFSENDSMHLSYAQITRRNNEACVICFADVAECILLPCKHRNCCIKCATRIKTCHMCRETIVKVFQPTYFLKIKQCDDIQSI
jgi:hypothetical protein